MQHLRDDDSNEGTNLAAQTQASASVDAQISRHEDRQPLERDTSVLNGIHELVGKVLSTLADRPPLTLVVTEELPPAGAAS